MDTRRATAVALLTQGLLLFLPLAVLGRAIDWPASLSQPAAVVLPAVHAHLAEVRAGYVAYFAYSVLFLVTGVLLVRVVSARLPGGTSVLAEVARVAAGVSALARTIGILRWLAPMPVLASQWNGAGEAERATLSVVYGALNDWGGAIGEVLGVTTFALVWLVSVCVLALREGTLPRWLAIAGFVSAAGLAVNALELFGYDLGPAISVSTTLVQLWFLAAGIVLWRPASVGRVVETTG